MKEASSTGARITVGHTIYAFNDGGMERGLLNLINHGDRERFRHVILCLTEAGAFAEQLASPDCTIVELHKREGNELRLPWRIAVSARRHQVDILHARGWPTLVETAVGARLARISQTIYGFHGKTFQDLEGLSFKRRWVQRALIRSYRRVVTLNKRMRADLARECALPENRIQIIANGVDVDTFRPRGDRNTLRAQFGFPADRFIIGNVARLDPVKNHEVVLQALRRIENHSLRPFFLLVGEGPHRAALERRIADWGLHGDVRLFGYSKRIPELLNCMNLYVQPSFYEGFSNTVAEAMACALPVLATDVGGTRDVLNAGVEGFFFEPDNAQALASLIARLMQDSRERQWLGEQARRQVVENFPIRSMVRRYEEMYLELAA